MKIIVDMMGGDNAPRAPMQGAARAVAELGVEIIALGDKAAMERAAQEHQIDLTGITLVHCSENIEMCDEPALAIRRKKDSSVVVGLNMLKNNEADAFVSGGSTGALHVGASLIVRTIQGVRRPALAVIMPSANRPFILMDAGANVECRANMLAGFAVMGTCYMREVMGVQEPLVGLVNNGAEESKGTPLYREAHALLKQTPDIHFAGNVEPREVPAGDLDVVVCDGFTGNVVLKLTEGVAKMLLHMIKGVFQANLAGNLAYLLVKKGVGGIKKAMDSEEYGGAPFLGAKKIVIKAHGSSEARGFFNAIRQAKLCVENDLCGTMEHALAKLAPLQQ